MNSQFDPRTVCPIEICGAIKNITPLTMGLSGAAVFAVDAERGAFVVRFHAHSASDWPSARDAYKISAAAGVAPKLFHIDEAHKALVTARVDGVPFGAALADATKRPLVFASLVQRLITLQNLQLPGATPSPDPVRAGREMWQAQSSRAGFPAWASGFAKHIENAAQFFARDSRRVFSHGDLNPANILWDGSQVWLVDWERAELHHPYMDLATLANFLSLPDAAAVGFLAAIEKNSPDKLSAEALAGFAALRNYARVAYGCVFLSRVGDLAAADMSSTKTLSECFAEMAAGRLSLATDGGRSAVAAAFFRQISG